MIKYANTELAQAFFASHPLRIDLADGSHVHFQDLICACRTAAHRRTGLWDEAHKCGMSYAECLQVANNADRRAVSA